jgi:hypothetical protein
MGEHQFHSDAALLTSLPFTRLSDHQGQQFQNSFQDGTDCSLPVTAGGATPSGFTQQFEAGDAAMSGGLRLR